MPACTIHLLALSVPLTEFLSALRKTTLKPITVSRVHRWIIRPTKLSALLNPPQWDILLILPDTSLPPELASQVAHSWHCKTGIPSRLLQDFTVKNARLLRPRDGDVPPLTGALDKPRIASSSQNLELSPELRTWISSSTAPHGAVSMLNLLAFLPNKKQDYLVYGRAFAESIGARRGGTAKLVGNVLGATSDGEEWEEFALAHYPSLDHFADMLASEDYQAVNAKWRVPSLKDTCILCTSEVDVLEAAAKL
jgi:hypothetical protein